jgi:hypothetical protein
MTDFDTRAWLDAQQEERRRIWSSIEWGLWGSGLGDVLREPVAATMVDALSDEQVTDVHTTMAAWQEHKAKQGSHPGWEELAKTKAEVARLNDVVQRVVGVRNMFFGFMDQLRDSLTNLCDEMEGDFNEPEADRAAAFRDLESAERGARALLATLPPKVIHGEDAEAVSGVH